MCLFLDLITIISVAQGRVKTSQEEDFFTDVSVCETWFGVKQKFLLFACFPKSFSPRLRLWHSAMSHTKHDGSKKTKTIKDRGSKMQSLVVIGSH